MRASDISGTNENDYACGRDASIPCVLSGALWSNAFPYNTKMRIEHVAMYVDDLERAREFFTAFFNGQSSAKYVNERTGFPHTLFHLMMAHAWS